MAHVLPFPREALRLDLSRRTQAVVVGAIAVVALVALRLTLSPATPAMASPLASPAEAAADLIGPARVVDADLLWIEGVEVRLNGVDAFDLTQTCGDVECGVEARRAVHRMIADRTVACRQADATTFICSVDGVDIGGALVRGGHATANAPRYLNAQTAARAGHAGAWAGLTEGWSPAEPG